MADVVKLDSVGCKDLVADLDSILLSQSIGIHPGNDKDGSMLCYLSRRLKYIPFLPCFPGNAAENALKCFKVQACWFIRVKIAYSNLLKKKLLLLNRKSGAYHRQESHSGRVVRTRGGGRGSMWERAVDLQGWFNNSRFPSRVALMEEWECKCVSVTFSH